MKTSSRDLTILQHLLCVKNQPFCSTKNCSGELLLRGDISLKNTLATFRRVRVVKSAIPCYLLNQNVLQLLLKTQIQVWYTTALRTANPGIQITNKKHKKKEIILIYLSLPNNHVNNSIYLKVSFINGQ